MSNSVSQTSIILTTIIAPTSARTISQAAAKTMAGIGEAASIIAVIDLSAKVASICFQYSREVAGAKNEILSLQAELSGLQDVLEKLKHLLEQPDSAKLSALPEINHALDAAENQLKELDKKLDIEKSRNPLKRYGLRALKWPFESNDVRKIIDRLERFKSTISLAFQPVQTSLVLAIHRRLDLNKLPQAKGATFDSYANENEPRCHPDTRRDLLREIDHWLEGPDGKCMYWLYGVAGSGKSTISRTVAKSLAAKGVLWASFFFKRGEGDRGNASRFFTTIASQLANKLPDLASHIANALENDAGIVDKAVEIQYEELILKPLSAIWQSSSTDPEQAVIVIDALDECDEEQQRIQTILNLLSKLRDVRGLDLRIFVTSRPEFSVRLGFKKIYSNAHKDVALHDIPEHTVDHDLRVVFLSELEHVRDEYSIQPPWPAQDDLETLVSITRPLFIHAATICRFVSDTFLGDPRDLLEKVLRSGGNSSTSDLSATYYPVLYQFVAKRQKWNREIVLQRFRLVVGTIVTLMDPLPKTSIAKLLNMSTSDLDCVLDYLHSVMRVPSDAVSPIQLFHLSFHDFLVDEKQCDPDFWIDEKGTHERTATRCIELMSATGELRENIWGLEYPGKLRSEVSSDTIDTHLSAELRYACRYWVEHLRRSGRSICDNDDVHCFLQKHSLHLLEALVYCSALVFAPNNSILKRMFSGCIPYQIRTIPDLQSDCAWVKAVAFIPNGKQLASGSIDRTVRLWDVATGELRQTFEGHTKSVRAVAFSQDGKQLVSGSDDKTLMSGSNDQTLRLWDVTLGELRQTFKMHSNRDKAMAFSPNKKLLASGSAEKIVRLWDVTTGELKKTFLGHNDTIRAVEFSPNGKQLASGSNDNTIRLWDLETGELRQLLEGHTSGVWAVAFSPNGMQLATGSVDKTVRLWAVDVEKLRCSVSRHNRSVWAIAFSTNGEQLVSGSSDKTVQLWDVITGKLLQTFEGHSKSIRAVAFSPDGKQLVSGSSDKTVRIWDTETAELRQTFEGHKAWVIAVAFSLPDGKQLVSGSDDQTIRIWDIETGVLRQILEGHSGPITAVAFSPNGEQLASGSDDKSVRIWDVTTGKLQQTLETNDGLVEAVTFSPNGKQLMSDTSDNIVLLWDVSTGKLQQTFKGYCGSISVVPYSSSGNGYMKAGSSLLSSNNDENKPDTIDIKAIAGIFIDTSWLVVKSQKTLWLPLDLRPQCSAIHRHTIALGCRSGQVLFLKVTL
ncbi:vegetative incompatibility protein HET-E-1 [Bisporella sp. PMI_857]|nr:vegetative incompatibility protein HET-E-1 [Bisporella sp. PMI_857]